MNAKIDSLLLLYMGLPLKFCLEINRRERLLFNVFMIFFYGNVCSLKKKKLWRRREVAIISLQIILYIFTRRDYFAKNFVFYYYYFVFLFLFLSNSSHGNLFGKSKSRVCGKMVCCIMCVAHHGIYVFTYVHRYNDTLET